MDNKNDKPSGNDVGKRRMKCFIRKIELIESDHSVIDISIDVDTSDAIDRDIAAQLHLGSAEVIQ